MLKTTMGMLGEYEYDTVYNESDVPPITWAVYVGFLVINCVIIVNLLVSIISYSKCLKTLEGDLKIHQNSNSYFLFSIENCTDTKFKYV